MEINSEAVWPKAKKKKAQKKKKVSRYEGRAALNVEQHPPGPAGGILVTDSGQGRQVGSGCPLEINCATIEPKVFYTE